ncbi:MAG: hypothetical protein GY838_06320 [bacterium]|nr:hypothetical protein [bacterium]
MEFRFFDPWHGFLPRECGHVVSCAGAGAKTGLLAACAEVLASNGAPVAAPGHPETDHERLVMVLADAEVGLPAAVPEASPPVWPTRTSLALLVMGADAVGSRAGEVVAGFGAGSPLLPGLGPDDLLEWDHLAALVLEPGGYLDGVPPEVPVALVLTGLSEQPDSIGLFACVDRFMAHPRLPIVVLGDPDAEPPVLRAAYRADEGEPDVD